MVLTTVLSMMRYVSDIDDRDFVDRLHSYFTTNLLIGLSVLVSFKQFGGKPVECLTPDIFSGAWEEYAENFCWAQDTYFVAPQSVVDGMPGAERAQRKISYYQWVPFFLLIEAACFRLPSLLWKCLAGHSGIKIREIVKLSTDPNNIKPDIKRANIKSLTVHLQGALRFHRRLHRRQIRPHTMLRVFNLPYSACFVSCMYLLTKFAYLCNVFFQLCLLNSFLETNRYSFYGFGALKDLLNGTTWQQSGMFPRVSLCDFQVRVMGNIQEYTIQCVLVINIFNEKIFVFLWFWYVCLLVFTCGSFIFWLVVFILPYPNRRFISRHLEMCEMPFDPEANEKSVARFIDTYLRSDGVFVVRMLTLHSGIIFGTDLVLSLWQSFFGVEQQLKRSNSVGELHPADSMEKMDSENGFNTALHRRPHADGLRQRAFGENLLERLVPPPSPPASMLRALNAIQTDSSKTTTKTSTPAQLQSPPSYRPPRPGNTNPNPAEFHLGGIGSRVQNPTKTNEMGVFTTNYSPGRIADGQFPALRNQPVELKETRIGIDGSKQPSKSAMQSTLRQDPSARGKT